MHNKERAYIEKLLNAPNELEQICQQKQLTLPIYELTNTFRTDNHEKLYELTLILDRERFSDKDRSKRLAKCRAALKALNFINELEADDNVEMPPYYNNTDEPNADTNGLKSTIVETDFDDEDESEKEENKLFRIVNKVMKTFEKK